MIDSNTKKSALRMVPYGLYVLISRGPNDQACAAAVNWVTQASFKPLLQW